MKVLHKKTLKLVRALRKALIACAGCVDAAEAEGLVEAVEGLRGNPAGDRLIDLVERRLVWPRNYATEILEETGPKEKIPLKKPDESKELGQ